MDAGGRATQEQLPRGLGEGDLNLESRPLYSPHHSIIPEGEGFEQEHISIHF